MNDPNDYTDPRTRSDLEATAKALLRSFQADDAEGFELMLEVAVSTPADAFALLGLMTGLADGFGRMAHGDDWPRVVEEMCRRDGLQ